MALASERELPDAAKCRGIPAGCQGECLSEFQKQMDLAYNEPYEQVTAALDETMRGLEEKLNAMIDYGDALPFPDLEFPFPPSEQM